MKSPILLIARRCFARLALIGAVLCAAVCQAQRAPLDPSHTLGVESCRECHEAIVDSWERSRHATSFSSLASSEAAAAMARLIGMKPDAIATSASCVRCHFTQETLASAVQTTAAVSCESCHGGAEQWIDVHNSKSRSRGERVEKAIALGMNHPASSFAVAKGCVECHVIDDEQLVNRAGHPALSEGFEVLSWYSGEVKHNFLVAREGKPLKSNGREAQPIAPAHQRMLFLTGKLLQLSQSLHALAGSVDAPVDKAGRLVRLPNGRPTYGVQHARTIARLTQEIRQLPATVDIPEFTRALGIMESVPLSTGHAAEMAAAATEIERLAEQFSKQNDGARFAALDSALRQLPVHGAGPSKPQVAGR